MAARSSPSAGEEMSDELRALLWSVIHAFLFAPRDGRAIERLWSSPPLSGDPAQLPEDVAELIESWFCLVERGDALELVEAAHESLDPSLRARFAEACNGAFARAGFGRRFVSPCYRAAGRP